MKIIPSMPAWSKLINTQNPLRLLAFLFHLMCVKSKTMGPVGMGSKSRRHSPAKSQRARANLRVDFGYLIHRNYVHARLARMENQNGC